MPFLTLGGATLRYDRAGAGPAVLLIHGWLGNRTVWERQVAALRDRFTVVTVDLRGHGESSPPRSGYTIGGMAADMEQLVRAIGVPRIALVGWSMGGLIAQELARRLGDRCTALVLVGTTPGGLTDAKNPHADLPLVEQMRAAVTADFRGFVRTFVPTLFKAGSEAPLVAWLVGQCQRTPPHVAEICLESVLATDFRDKLSAVKAPTLVIHGRHDAIFKLAMGEELKKGIRGAQLVVFEESGHAPNLEEPERFNEVVGEFVASAGGAVAKPVSAPAAAPKPAEKAEAKKPEKTPAKRPEPKKPEKKAARAGSGKKPPKKKR
jgi:pimeloyl-ACP methyl ester esterase